MNSFFVYQIGSKWVKGVQILLIFKMLTGQLCCHHLKMHLVTNNLEIRFYSFFKIENKIL